MKRRDVISFLGATALAFPHTVRAQRVAPTIGFLSSLSPNAAKANVEAFNHGLRESGFVEGQNIRIVFRWANGRYDELPVLASELVRLRVSLLFASGGPPSALAAKSATSTIPIVFSAASDPVKLGLVASLNRPGGNVTGMSAFATELVGKRLELVRELLPARTVGYLINPRGPNAGIETKLARDAALALGLELHFATAVSADDFGAAFADAVRRRVGGIVIAGGDPYFALKRELLVALAAQHAIPAIYGWREFVVIGGLVSYGTSLPDSYRRAAIYVSRILKGEKPADLPVMQPNQFHLALNLKTAKALGLTIPQPILVRSDEVIE